MTAALQGAFKDKNTQGVVLRINRPGGSPVQAGHHQRRDPPPARACIRTSRCTRWSRTSAPRAATTSPSAADKIYVDKASIVGSIGVLMDGFGFIGTMEKLGVERRAAHRRREQGLPRSVLAARAAKQVEHAKDDARRDPPAVHRRGQARAAASA